MEDTFYRQELNNDFKTKTEEQFEARESRLFGLKAERERQRLKFVEQMRIRQMMLVAIYAFLQVLFLRKIFLKNVSKLNLKKFE